MRKDHIGFTDNAKLLRGSYGFSVSGNHPLGSRHGSLEQATLAASFGTVRFTRVLRTSP
jgi:hypothetical protein